MIYDLYAMYDDDYHRLHLDIHPHLATRMATFIKKRWSMITHHLTLFLLGYPLIVVSMGGSEALFPPSHLSPAISDPYNEKVQGRLPIRDVLHSRLFQSHTALCPDYAAGVY